MKDTLRGLVLFFAVAALVCWGAYRLLSPGSGVPREAWYHPDHLAAHGYPRPVKSNPRQ